MLGLPLTFATPAVLIALLSLPIIWWLLRLTPPKPRQEFFPPTRILARLLKKEETPAHSPWWLILLRLTMAALVIIAMAGPIWNPQKPLISGAGPVLIVVDNSWSSSTSWDAQVSTANRILNQAQGDDRTVSLLFSVGDSAADLIAGSAQAVRQKLLAASPEPVRADWQNTITKITNFPETAKPSSIIWLSGGLDEGAANELARSLSKLVAGEFDLYLPDLKNFVGLSNATNNPVSLDVSLRRPLSQFSLDGTIRAFDQKGRLLATAPYIFDGGADTTIAKLKFPVELRNEIARVELSDKSNAGGIYLLDERFRRRRVGLISGEKSDIAQPLLSPLYYISRALGPYSEIRYPVDANIDRAVETLIEDNVSTLVLADIGTLSNDTSDRLATWVNKGGMLVRFAGPRLAAASNAALVPVKLRSGGRNLGGSLSWSTPQPLASFNPQSPFADLVIPDDVTVNRQVLAEPDIDLPQYTWASLADGTPLVTAAKRGSGWIVLFHITANASWSNLVLSGSFVDMLRRIVSLSGHSGFNILTRDSSVGKTIVPPYRTLDAKGQLVAPPANAEPLTVVAGQKNSTDYNHPPGLYGTSDGFVALNLLDKSSSLLPLDAGALPGSPAVSVYEKTLAMKLAPWLLAIALLLLGLDSLAVIWMAGVFGRRVAVSGAGAVMAAFAFFAPDSPALSQQAATDTIPFGIEATLTTRMAYVITGIPEVDEISRRGLSGLANYITTRTSLEPGEPIGVDIAVDELSFYPLIYWPVDPRAELPDAKTMARIDSFMKKGGSVIFDTKDALSGGFGGITVSDATLRLRQILATLDIPPLERVPSDHVLTKSFYLLSSFPGRYNLGALWVEVSEAENDSKRPVRVGDGVSSILITSNDFAGAWAVDDNGQYLLPTVPSSPRQRTYAYRVGVNLMMYALTGNYKSDQVHIPALLERLGQ